MRILTVPLRVFPTLKRIQKLSSLVQPFLSDGLHPLSVWRQLLGVMSSVSALVPGARLCMHSLQLRLNVAGSRLQDEDPVPWDDSCLPDLRWWSDVSHLQAGLPLESHRPHLFLFTDASDTGWGVSLGDDQLSGLWSQDCSNFSINHRELLAVLFAIRGFLPCLQGQMVALYADNNTALAYLRKQGGTRSQTLNSVGQTILRFCESHRIRLLPQFIPGKLNVLADLLSRKAQALCSEAFHQLLHRWPATIDLFATSLNHRLPVYFSLMVDPQSAGTDALLQLGTGSRLMPFPPSV